MKIYSQDHGVYGCVIAIANSKEEAIELMDIHYRFDGKEEITEEDITPGWVYCNLGDA